jgi:YtkA-like
VRALLVALVAALLVVPGAAAARPSIAIDVTGTGYDRVVTVRVYRGAKPVNRAKVVVSASMRHPGHHMNVPPRAARRSAPGVYRVRLSFLMLGQWRVMATVDGRRRSIAVRL